MTSFRDQFIKYSLVGIFILAIISFAVNMQLENGITGNDSLLNNEILNKTFNDLEGNLSNSEGKTQEQKTNFDSEIPERGFGSLLVFAIVGVVQTFTSTIVGIYNIMIVLPASILGIPSAVISTLSSILLVTLVILAWRVYRAGE